MKKILLIISILICLIGIVFAQEAPKYNFGSAQGDKNLRVSPGETLETKLYFYNVYGNRITHITLSAAEVPEGWNVEFDPALHITTVSVSGIQTNVTENLYVEPSEAVEEIPATVPEGIEYISSKIGYIGANPVTVKITVPKDEKLGKVARVKIDASASWLGQTGGVALEQGRSFEYSINVVSKEFTETILEKPPVEEEKPKEEVLVIKEEKPLLPTEIPIVVEKQVGVPTSTFVGVVIVLIIIIVGMFIFFAKKKK